MFPREFTFSSFINYAYICTCIRRHLKETVLWGTITWSEIRKQSIQAKKVYYFLSGNGPMKSCLRWTSKFHYQASDCNNNINLNSDLDADDLLEVCV